MTNPDRIIAEENLLIDFQFLIQDTMNQVGLSRDEVALRAGITPWQLSQLLTAEANPSVKMFARVMHAMGKKIVVTAISPIE